MSHGENNTIEHEGELFSSTCRMTWMETGAQIASGNTIVPISLPASAKTVEHAALHLAADDLTLARDSFSEAAKLGLPSDKNSLSKALIHAGVLSYARSFAGGIRGVSAYRSVFCEYLEGGRCRASQVLVCSS